MKTVVRHHMRRTPSGGVTGVVRHDRSLGDHATKTTTTVEKKAKWYDSSVTLPNAFAWYNTPRWMIGTYDGNHPTKKSFYILDKKTGQIDYPVVYDDGRVGYDNPERIPAVVKRNLEKNSSRWSGKKLGGNYEV